MLQRADDERRLLRCEIEAHESEPHAGAASA
jgi:hypothetical protein